MGSCVPKCPSNSTLNWAFALPYQFWSWSGSLDLYRNPNLDLCRAGSAPSAWCDHCDQIHSYQQKYPCSGGDPSEPSKLHLVLSWTSRYGNRDGRNATCHQSTPMRKPSWYWMSVLCQRWYHPGHWCSPKNVHSLVPLRGFLNEPITEHLSLKSVQ